MKRWSEELIYTILVDGQPVVTLEAKGREAAELCREEWFRADLCALSSNGEPLCKTGSKLQARVAGEVERVKYREGSNEAKASDDLLFVYYRPAHKPPTRISGRLGWRRFCLSP